jgi:DNA-binding transcriptional LysR family regulator
MDLRGVDLNLLVSLRVLLTQRHVTRSAEKLGISQPAVSAALARSRAVGTELPRHGACGRSNRADQYGSDAGRNSFGHSLPIVAYDLPLAVPAAEVTMFWHPRSHEDVGHEWLRDEIAVLLQA